jgi:hypothetical protein
VLQQELNIKKFLNLQKVIVAEEKMFIEWQHKVWIKLFNMLIAIEEIGRETLEGYGSRE